MATVACASGKSSGARVKKICFVATTPFVVNAFLLGHLSALADRYHVFLYVNLGDYPLSARIDPRICVVDVAIQRKMSPWGDLKAIAKLIRLFREERFDSVHSITPKAGLLAMLGAMFARVPYRFHTFTGQVWANHRGLVRFIFKQIDRLIVVAANRVFADSQSQCDFLAREGITSPGVISVLGNGSICGVDPKRFFPDQTEARKTRTKLDTSYESCVFLFVGRLTRDKGVFDLLRAFGRLAKMQDDATLWVVGPDEEGLQAELVNIAGELGARICWIGPSFAPEQFMAAADVLVLPSFREGFGMVILEAAACGIPSVAYRIDGVTDAIQDGTTGILSPKGDVDALCNAMLLMLEDSGLRTRLGQCARERAHNAYSSVTVTSAWVNFYDSVLKDEMAPSV